jgi:uncharacterized membrane protein YadS
MEHMMQQAQTVVADRHHAPVLAVLSWLIGIAMVLAIIIGMSLGKVMGWKGQVGVLILSAVPVCTVGTVLAIASLIWRKEDKRVVQGALWLNGLLGFFAFPILVYWLLAMW